MGIHQIHQMLTNLGRACRGWKFLFVLIVSCFCNEILAQSIVDRLVPDCNLGRDSVDYFLYNRELRTDVVIDLKSNNIPVDPKLMTIFLVHGFTSEANTSQYIELTKVLIDKYDVNVFSLDWRAGACSTGGISLTQILSYPSAVRNTRIVGERLSAFIGRLIEGYGMKLENIILIGHSLGAQVVGFAGKDLQKQRTGTLRQILALDPAGPGFESNSCSQRICVSDADFVQVFHTSYAFGMHRAVGNIDFYFNGGRNQPNCPTFLDRMTCSHSKAITYIIDILKDPDCKFIGKKWTRSDFFEPTIDCSEDTCSVPGPLAPTLPARGTFWVDPKDLPSFCRDRS